MAEEIGRELQKYYGVNSERFTELRNQLFILSGSLSLIHYWVTKYDKHGL